MGYIYKIQNIINNHLYIGQTVKSLEKRFQQHRNNYDKPYFSHLPLYRAFQKYGLENFIFEKVEEVENEKLDEREKYWINYYNSFYDGYNATLGGRSVSLYNWDWEEIYELYMIHKSARRVAKIIRCDHSTIDNLLNLHNVKRFSAGEQLNKTIVLEKDDNKYYFNSTKLASEWLIENKHSKTTNYKSVLTGILNAINYNKKYLNFKIYYESKR